MVTVGTSSGQSQRCVAVAILRHAGTTHVVQSSPVTVTVGQPVCAGGSSSPPPSVPEGVAVGSSVGGGVIESLGSGMLMVPEPSGMLMVPLGVTSPPGMLILPSSSWAAAQLALVALVLVRVWGWGLWMLAR